MKGIFRTIAAAAAISLLCTSCGTGGVRKADEGTVKLKYVIKLNSQKNLPEIEAKVNEYIKDKIGAEIEFVRVDSGSYNQKLKTMLASNEQFDLMYDANTHNFTDHARNGVLMPLDELIEKYAPKTYKNVPEKIWDAARVDGKLYGVINYQIVGRAHGFAFDKKLTEKYNFDTAKVHDLEDIEPFLQAVKSGEAPDYIPFGALNQGFWSTMLIQYGFDYVVTTTTPGVVRIEDKENKVINQFESKEFEDYCRIMNEYYNKGYIKKDAATITNTSDVLGMGKTGVIYNNQKPGGLAETSTRMGGKKIIYAQTASPFVNNDFASATLTVIGKQCKNPEKAMQFIELLNTDKYLYNLMCFGIENEHYKKVGENRIELIPDSGYNPNSSWEWGCQFNAYLLPIQEDNVWEETKKINESARVSNLMGFQFDSTPVKSEIAQCAAVSAEYMSGLGVGAADYKNQLEEFKAKLKTAGVDKIISEQQKQIDEWMKR